MDVDISDVIAAHRDRAWEPDGVSGTVRMALVGLGGFTVDRVAPAIEQSEYVEASAVVSGSSEKAARVANELDIGVSLTYNEFHAGVDRSSYDAVFIATPNGTHLEHVQSAADIGKPVLCEKPMEATANRAETMVRSCRDAGVPLMIAYRLQTNPLVRAARQLIHDGVIGEPVHCRGSMSQRIFEIISPDPEQWRLNAELSGGAALIDLGVYPLNTARFLLEEDPMAVHAFERRENDAFAEVDEHIAFEVLFESGAIAACTASQNSYEQGHLHITGTTGELALDPAFMGPATLHIRNDEIDATIEPGDADEVTEEMDYFASRVLTETRIEPSGEHGLTDMKTMDAIYESARTDQRVQIDI